MPEEKEQKEPGVVRYSLGRFRERLVGRLLCLFGRHRFREEGVTVCMRCLQMEVEGLGRIRRGGMGRRIPRSAVISAAVAVGIVLWLFPGSPLSPFHTSAGPAAAASPAPAPSPVQAAAPSAIDGALRLLPAMDSFQVLDASRMAAGFGNDSLDAAQTTIASLLEVPPGSSRATLPREGFEASARQKRPSLDQHGGTARVRLVQNPQVGDLRRNHSTPENALVHAERKVMAFLDGSLAMGTAEGVKRALSVARGETPSFGDDPEVQEFARQFPGAFFLSLARQTRDNKTWEGLAGRARGSHVEATFVTRFSDEPAAQGFAERARSGFLGVLIDQVGRQGRTVFANGTTSLPQFLASFVLEAPPVMSPPRLSLRGASVSSLCIGHEGGSPLLLDRDNLTLAVDGRDILNYKFDPPGEALAPGKAVLFSGIGLLETGSTIQIFDSAEGQSLAKFDAPPPAVSLLRCS